MKKTLLGKITFILACIFLFMYISGKIYAIWMVGNRLGGWDNLMNLSLSIGGYGTVKIISNNFIMPIIWSIIYAIYIFAIWKNKKIERFIFAVTALAISVEMVFYILDNLYGNGIISFLPLLLRIGFLLAFIMLFMGWTKELLKKIVYAVLCGSYICTLAYVLILYIRNMTALIQMSNSSQGIMRVFEYAGYFMFPILELVVYALIISYILFPAKHFKSAE